MTYTRALVLGTMLSMVISATLVWALTRAGAQEIPDPLDTAACPAARLVEEFTGMGDQETDLLHPRILASLS